MAGGRCSVRLCHWLSFYSTLRPKVLVLDPVRATPAERLENRRDFIATNKSVVFGHHFAAIAGPGGPVLAAQFGYLPVGWPELCRGRLRGIPPFFLCGATANYSLKWHARKSGGWGDLSPTPR